MIGSIICFLPFLFRNSYIDDDRQTIARSINSEYHLDSLLLSLVACLIIGFDVVLDFFFGSINQFKSSFPRWSLLLSLILPNGTMFFVYKATLPHHMSPELFSTMSNIREILFQSALLTFLLTSATETYKFSSHIICITQITLVFGITVFQFGNFMLVQLPLVYSAYLALMISAVLILWMVFSRYSLFLRRSKLCMSQPHSCYGDLENIIYPLCLGFNIFGRYFVFLVTSTTVDMAKGYQSSIFNIIDVVTVLIIISVHGRKSREEFVLFQV